MNILHSENKLLGSVFKKFLFGTVIAIVCTVLGVIANGIIIGNFFGKIGLSAFALTTPLVYGTLAIGYIFSYGGSIVCSNNFADKDRVNNNFTVAILFSFCHRCCFNNFPIIVSDTSGTIPWIIK